MIKYIYSIALLFLLMSGGNAQSFGNPDIRMDQEPRVEKANLESSANILPLEGNIDVDRYILGPGDEIGLNILTAENFTFPLKVTPTGDLFIPAVGITHVAGLTLTEAASTVEAFIHEQAYPGSQVNLVLLSVRHFKIQVFGAVNKPCFVVVTPIDRLSEIIEKCEGFHQLAREFEIKITHDSGENQTLNYLAYLREGDLKNNPTFIEGDKIYVPFGDMETEGIVTRGPVAGGGYDIIEPNETIGSYLQRRVIYNKNADVESLLITRAEEGKNIFISVDPKELFMKELHAGETLDIQREKGIMINGFVLSPGGFEFFPGYTAADYISMAGGNTENGNPSRCIVRHRDGTTERGQRVLIRRGDVIVVPRTFKDYIIGSSSILQVTASLLTIYLTYIASGASG